MFCWWHSYSGYQRQCANVWKRWIYSACEWVYSTWLDHHNV